VKPELQTADIELQKFEFEQSGLQAGAETELSFILEINTDAIAVD
jgi:hypothetical protein